MTSSNALPVEIVEKIISFVCLISPSRPTEPLNSAEQPFLTHPSVVQLLKLRLVAKSWAAAVPRFVYRSLYLRTPIFNHYLIRMWINCLSISNLSNLRRLCLDQVLYIPASKATGYHMALSDECSPKHIKLLEYTTTRRPQESKMLLLAVRNSLEALTVDSIPDDLPRSIRIQEFPKLRIIRCKYINPSSDRPIWFEWSLFHTVEVIITNYCESRTFWEIALLPAGGPHLKEANKLKTFIFIMGDDDPIEDPELAQFFNTYGFICHFKSGINDTEILELLQNEKHAKDVDARSQLTCILKVKAKEVYLVKIIVRNQSTAQLQNLALREKYNINIVRVLPKIKCLNSID
ncbi:uncharacterized protein MELLADRAFT_114367 [Melampsora larici-populina 98AG31]|uniref:F-box domain-containing protein n=1 Tax=Melampsora larici-populina (strain 98AG31 / pathotype 3-4-7) TaxID=747676 RepID=F4SD73_MELLP|nr:uncharacterized protein MELLADRAFT_114367 [Melampsora larici-populina 98AG31]EGF97406.1 hypothetical protein MELLADRAFT_114367 [Melampsora larici-populina 98AG31]